VSWAHPSHQSGVFSHRRDPALTRRSRRTFPPENKAELPPHPSSTPRPPSSRGQTADRRNSLWIREADKADLDTLGKPPPNPFYLSFDVDALFPPIQAPNDTFVPPDWLHKSMMEIADTDTPVPLAPLIRSDTSPESLRHNTQILADLDFDFEEFMA
jgi:hypothetical protein